MKNVNMKHMLNDLYLSDNPMQESQKGEALAQKRIQRPTSLSCF
jgi:hypothetical protein